QSLVTGDPDESAARPEGIGRIPQFLDGDLAVQSVGPVNVSDREHRGLSIADYRLRPKRFQSSIINLQSRIRMLTFRPRTAAATNARRARTVRPSRPISLPRSPSGTAIS